MNPFRLGAEGQADDQYAQLIRETEAILTQLENDELLLGAGATGAAAANLFRRAPSVVRRP